MSSSAIAASASSPDDAVAHVVPARGQDRLEQPDVRPAGRRRRARVALAGSVSFMSCLPARGSRGPAGEARAR